MASLCSGHRHKAQLRGKFRRAKWHHGGFSVYIDDRKSAYHHKYWRNPAAI